MFSALGMPLKATPTRRPSETAGPPLLPGLSAASICTRRPCVPRKYALNSTREMIPSVTDICSPPSGNPYTLTVLLTAGNLSDIGTAGCVSKKAASSRLSRARSMAGALTTTLAGIRSAERFGWT